MQGTVRVLVLAYVFQVFLNLFQVFSVCVCVCDAGLLYQVHAEDLQTRLSQGRCDSDMSRV